MPENESVRWLLKEAILKALREELTFAVREGDIVRELQEEAIVFRRNAVQDRPHEEYKQNEMLPGIFLSAPLSESINPNDGENAHDVWPMTWLIQIVDNENYEREGDERTYWRWQEQIAVFFMFSEYLMSLDLGEHICLKSVVVTMVDQVDEKLWLKSSLFRSGVTVTANVLRPRGVF